MTSPFESNGVDAVDWTRVAVELDARGWRVLPGLLDAAECEATAVL